MLTFDNPLHVVPPTAMQHATLHPDNATCDATTLQHTSLKALAHKVLARNKSGNHHVTDSKNQCNTEAINSPKKLHHFFISHNDVKVASGDDWDIVKDNPHLFSAVSDALRTRLMMSQGIVPTHYTKTVSCLGCGSVKLWEDCPDQVLGCPWCLLKTTNLQGDHNHDI